MLELTYTDKEKYSMLYSGTETEITDKGTINTIVKDHSLNYRKEQQGLYQR